MTSIYFTISGFFCIVLLMILFFSKARIKSKETKLYGLMLISSFIDLILVMLELILTAYFYNDITKVIVIMLNKIDFIHYIIWPTMLFLYTYYITYTGDKKYEKIKNSVIIMDALFIVTEFALPVNIIKDNNVMGVTGMGSNFTYIIALVYLLSLILILIMNIKKIKEKKYTPIYVLLLMCLIALIVRAVNPTLIVIPAIVVYKETVADLQ